MVADVLAGRYEIHQVLGQNAGRRTVLARDLQTQEFVVVKLLIFSGEFQWQDLKLFEREAETLKALSHPAIPRYLDYFEVDQPNCKGFALVQTYIEARSLRQQVQAGRTFNEAEVKQIAIALLQVLIYLHDRQPRVIHRDLKPSNVLLTNRSGSQVGEVYLVDFGSVQTVARDGGTMTIVGTYGYMPPEQFGGRSSPASDLYSLGATLIHLVTGQEPADLPQRKLRIQFEQAARLSPQFTHWLKWLTEPSPEDRPASANAALQVLERPQVLRSSPTTPAGIIQQPAYSRIQVHRKPTVLEILVPSQRAIFYQLRLSARLLLLDLPAFLLGLLLGLVGILLILSGLSLLFQQPFPINLIIGFFIGLLGANSLSFASQLMRPIWSTLQRQGNLKHIRIQWRRDLELQYIKGQSITVLSDSGNQRIDCSRYSFSPQELDWLAQEISAWASKPLVQGSSRTDGA